MHRIKKAITILLMGTLIGGLFLPGMKMGAVKAEEVSEVSKAEPTVEQVAQQSADTTTPKITNLRLVPQETIYSETQLAVQVEYEETQSGLGSLMVIYKLDNSLEESQEVFSGLKYVEGGYVGVGTVTMTSSGAYRFPGTYTVSEIRVTDNEGNTALYYLDSSSGELVNMDNEADRFRPDTLSYDVMLAESSGLCIKGYQMEKIEDRNHVTAGASFELRLTLQNDTDTAVSVDPELCCVSWYGYESGYTYAPAQGEVFMLAAGDEADLYFPIEIDRYTMAGERELEQIWINCWTIEGTGSNLPGVTYTLWGENTLVGCDLNYNAFDVQPYGGELSFTVTDSGEQDTTAPILTKIAMDPGKVAAPGKIDLKVWTESEQTEIDYVGVSFKDTDREQNWLTLYEVEVSYLGDEQCYVGEIVLDDTMVNGIYELRSITIVDKNGNVRTYEWRNGSDQMEEVFPEGDTPLKVNGCSFEITDSAADDDFTEPEIIKMELDRNELQAGQELTCILQAKDEMGLSKVSLLYYSTDIKLNGMPEFIRMDSKNVTLGAYGYICTFEVDPYCVPGEYELQSVNLYDGSSRANEAVCSYDKEGHCFVQGAKEIEVPADQSYDLLISQKEGTQIVNMQTTDLEKAAESAQERGTLVLTEAYIGMQVENVISPNFLQTVKEKDMMVIIPDRERNSEIVIHGSDISKMPESSLQLKVERKDMVEDMAGIGQDDCYYPVSVYATDTTVPFVLRIKVDDTFLEQCSKNPIRISKVNTDGSMTIVQDNLTVAEDGYLEVNFSNGLQKAGSATRTMNAKSAERSSAIFDYSFIVSSSTQKSEITRGDINGDGQINLVDLMQCLNHVGRKTELTGDALLAADIDQNGSVNLVDLMRLLNYVGRKSTIL